MCSAVAGGNPNDKFYKKSRKFYSPGAMEIVVAHGKSYNQTKCQFGKRAITPPIDGEKGAGGCIFAAKMRMFAVTLSIGAGSMFLVSLDSVVDNLIPLARKFLVDFYGSEKEANFAWGWVVSARSYGIAFGCFCAFLCSDCPSRKWPLIVSFLITFVGGILCMLIRVSDLGISLCCIGRFLSGLGSGMAQVIGSAMLAEIPQIRLRGTCLASLTVWACVGELAGLFMSLDTVLFLLSFFLPYFHFLHFLVLGTDETWHIALGLPVLIVPFSLAVLLMAPDSPRALFLSGNEKAAFESLKYYQNSEDWIPSMKDIKSELFNNYWQKDDKCPTEMTFLEKGQIVPQCCAKRCRFGTGKFVRPLLIGTFVLTLAHLDDWLWISYSTQAFENVGISTKDSQRASLWMAFPQALTSLCLLFFFDAFPRRHLLIWPTFGSIFCSFFAIYALNFGQTSFLNAKSLPLIASLDLCMAAIASGSAYSVTPELFQQSDRIMGTALIGIAQNIFGGFLTTIALPLMNSNGIEFVLLPFALLNIIYVVVISKKLPETNGKSFYEISERFSEKMPEIPLPTHFIRKITQLALIIIKKALLFFHSAKF